MRNNLEAVVKAAVRLAIHMFATDINAGPLARAKQTALEQNLSQQMEFYLCDG